MESAIETYRDTGEVEIATGATGGWDVTARLDGRVVAIRHCTDWHRAERARTLLQSQLHAGPRDVTAPSR